MKKKLWRASINCLPTKDQVRLKRVQVNAFCPICNDHYETVLRSLVLCPFAVSTWAKISEQLVVGDFATFTDWLQLIFEQQSKDNVLLVVMVCWMLWKNKNDLIWNQHSLESVEVI